MRNVIVDLAYDLRPRDVEFLRKCIATDGMAAGLAGVSADVVHEGKKLGKWEAAERQDMSAGWTSTNVWATRISESSRHPISSLRPLRSFVMP